MVSKTYTARELMRMRQFPAGKELYEQLYDKLRKDVELGDVFRLPPERMLHLIEEEPGHASGESDEFDQHQSSVARQLDGTDSEWKYRGRTDSDDAEGQPASGHPRLAAQKSDGFQKFYKAVVSPTHVRVTAGGRIVPNTRGSSSPTGKWSKERASADGTAASCSSNRDQSDRASSSYPQTAFGNFPPMFPGMAPGMPPGMPPGMVPSMPPGMAPGMPPGMPPGMTAGPAPFPMMPWHMSFNMGGGAYGMQPQQFGPIPNMKPASKKLTAASKNERQPDATSSESSNPVRVSAPEQFDHSRPCFYNGQWMMPPTHPYYPYGMTQPQGFHPHATAGSAMSSHRYAANAAAYSQGSKTGTIPQQQVAQASSASTSSVPGFAAPSNPPMSSIRSSDITKKQIEVLRVSLRYWDDQIQFNRHQIDEQAAMNHSRTIRQQIQNFEKNLEGQLAFEKSHFPKSERKEDTGESGDSLDPAESKLPAIANAKVGTGHRNEASQIHGNKSKPKHDKAASSSRVTTSAGSMKSVSASTSVAIGANASSDVENVKKLSTLPMAAALAPPFQPRTENNTPLSAAATMSSSPAASKTELQKMKSSADESFEHDHHYSPYLVGHLSDGVKSELAVDTDYVYPRELTEDEQRARHMYWGKAPPHLQRGLPKFDGKDFYPPSPVRGSSSDVTSSPGLSSRPLSVRTSDAEYPRMERRAHIDPFRSMPRPGYRLARHPLGNSTQSESLPRDEQSGVDTSYSGMQRHGSCATQVGRGYSDFRKAIEETTQTPGDSPKAKSSSDEGDDDSSLLFKGRKAMSRGKGTKTRNEIWQTVLKKGKSSANVIPGTVSSMTAQGVLPNYTGHATASLTPAMSNTSVSPRGAAVKAGGPSDARSASPVVDNRRENRPPADKKHR